MLRQQLHVLIGNYYGMAANVIGYKEVPVALG